MKKTPLSNYVIEQSPNTPVNKKIDNPNCSFLGGLSDQSFTAFFIWEKFFTRFKDHIKRFIEFGCDQGNTSVYFALWCMNMEAKYIGFDSKNSHHYSDTPVKRCVKLLDSMVIGNGYKKEDQIRKIIQKKGMCVIFTDCVDKPWEFRTFAPMLKAGDILAVHDWGRAIKDEWVEEDMKKLKPYELLYEEERTYFNTLTRFFRKL